MTTNKGIDYGNNQTNIDKETNIRYGVISQGSINPESLDDIYFGSNSTDRNYDAWKEEIKSKIESALDDFMLSSQAKELAEHAVEDYDNLGDCYQSDEINPHFDDNEYIIEKCLDFDLFIIKSPFFTYAQFCSPCVPGACNLDTPLNPACPNCNNDFLPENKTSCPAGDYYCDGCKKDLKEKDCFPDSNKCYCLGHDWFDDNKAPYPVFDVKTGNQVMP